VDVASGFAFGYDPTGRSVFFKIGRIPLHAAGLIIQWFQDSEKKRFNYLHKNNL
jgi:hypothetical protein